MTESNRPGAVLSEPAYKMSKTLVQTVIPLTLALYFIISMIWTGDANAWVLGIGAILSLFFGTALEVSSKHYYASPYAHDGEMVVIADGGGVRTFSLEVHGDPDDLALKSVITFKVRKTTVPEPPEF